MTEEPRWLTSAEQEVWRRWLALNARLQAALHRQLQADSGLSLQDFEVLVRLTDVPGGHVRVSELASSLTWERSRLSHHVTRMERRGLVEREECVDDGRGAFVAITTVGRDAIGDAAPGHVATVRRLFFDALDADDLEALATVSGKLLGRLEAAPER